MVETVQARLDPESKRALSKLARVTGWSTSRIIREGLRALAACHGPATERIVGLGKFSSGVKDLGSNKQHLRGFGK